MSKARLILALAFVGVFVYMLLPFVALLETL